MLICTHSSSQLKFEVVSLNGHLPFVDDYFEFKLVLNSSSLNNHQDITHVIKVQDTLYLDFEGSISGVVTKILSSDSKIAKHNTTMEMCFSHPLSLLKYSNCKSIVHQSTFKVLIEQILQPVLPMIKLNFLSKYSDDRFVIPEWTIQGNRYEAFQKLLNHFGLHYIIDSHFITTIYITDENDFLTIPIMHPQKMLKYNAANAESSQIDHEKGVRSQGFKTLQLHQKKIFKTCSIELEGQVLYIQHQYFRYYKANDWTVTLKVSEAPFFQKRHHPRIHDVQGLSIGQVSSQVWTQQGNYKITLKDQGYEQDLAHVEDLKLTHSSSAAHALPYHPDDNLVLLKHQGTHYILGAEFKGKGRQTKRRKQLKNKDKAEQLQLQSDSMLYALKLSKAAGMVITQSKILKIRFRQSGIFLKDNMEVNSQGSSYLRAKSDLSLKSKQYVMISDNIRFSAHENFGLDSDKVQLSSLSLLWQSDDIVMALPFVHMQAQDIYLTSDETSFISEILDIKGKESVNLYTINSMVLNSEFTLNIQVGLASILFQNRQIVFSGTCVRMQAGIINISSPKGN